MLAVKFCKACDVAVKCVSCNSPEFDITFGNTRHRSRKTKTNRAHAGVRHSSVAVFAGTESLGFCQKLGVDFASDYDFISVNCHFLILKKLCGYCIRFLKEVTVGHMKKVKISFLKYSLSNLIIFCRM